MALLNFHPVKSRRSLLTCVYSIEYQLVSESYPRRTFFKMGTVVLILCVAVLATSSQIIATKGDDVALRIVADSTENFAHNFTKVIANKNSGNFVVSPLSAQITLAMAAYGAGGSTARQMRTALFVPEDNELGQSGYKSIIEILKDVKGVELSLSNTLFTSSQFQVKSAYKKFTGAKFLSPSQEVDFSDLRSAADAINAWCEQKTNNRIKGVVAADDLSPFTQLVLVSAVHFKGGWRKEFDSSETQDRAFYVDENTTKNVPTMYMKYFVRNGQLPEISAKFIELRFWGEDMSMIIILPDEITGLKTVTDNMHKVNLSRSLDEAYYQYAEVHLPYFAIETTLDLQQPLQELGIRNMFRDGADFSGISDIPLKVGRFVQKAFIKVEEEGSEAADVTMIHDVPANLRVWMQPPKVLSVDRPFQFMIYHLGAKIVLVSGMVHQPDSI